MKYIIIISLVLAMIGCSNSLEKDRVKKGDKFITQKTIETDGLTSWAAPYTGSFRCTLPKETIVVAIHDQVEGAKGFGVVPEKYDELESQLVPESDRTHKKYSGYSFVFLSENIGDTLMPLKRR